ncbi:MAG TPA: diphosphate--fructose-6-phosphate 1-phosphotransferase, partial [Spirochaetia bacterium]|nr:diphosphate--fructose-6-phosphate 1-phosphotransferase [Spirochaetia bacterium]
MEYSPLQKNRYTYKPKLPPILTQNLEKIAPKIGKATEAAEDREELKRRFPHTYGMPMVEFNEGENREVSRKSVVGVILSGGQAPGGHNVIAGLFDALKKGNPDSKLLGFLGGPSGILEDKHREITAEYLEAYRNTGGFDMIGSGRTKIETPEQFDRCLEVCTANQIEGLVIIGGDDSNTNAAILAEYFAGKGVGITVVGVPKTIDGDLKNEYIETSFGFDTATKTYSELIGNIERDAASAGKYWHFIRLMGRSASHIALECALKTRPNVTIISEEVEQKGRSLSDIVAEIAGVVAHRGNIAEDFGVVLVPEGLLEFVPEMRALIEEINSLLAKKESEFATLKTAE